MNKNEYFIVKGQKKLRCGYTTGSCAAAVAKAGTLMVLTEIEYPIITLETLKGLVLNLEVASIVRKQNSVICSVKKDGGDDPDITHGISIFGKITKVENGRGCVLIRAGLGIGIVTEPGLPCPVGSPAINPSPQKQIKDEVKKIMVAHNFNGDIIIELWIPEGPLLAEKTFNPKIGIKGGLSILGTTGIVEPMSEKAFIDTLKIEIDSHLAKNNDCLLFCSGNYGKHFATDTLEISIDHSIKYGNYIGEVLDYLVYRNVKKALFISHIGKIVKVAAGIMNTWSKIADGRMEIFGVHCGMAGGTREDIKNIMEMTNTEVVILYLKQKELFAAVQESVMDKIINHMKDRVRDQVEIEVIVFYGSSEIFGTTSGVENYLNGLKEAD